MRKLAQLVAVILGAGYMLSGQDAVSLACFNMAALLEIAIVTEEHK